MTPRLPSPWMVALLAVAATKVLDAPRPASAAGELAASRTTLNFPSVHVGAATYLDVAFTNVSGATQTVATVAGGSPTDDSLASSGQPVPARCSIREAAASRCGGRS